MRKLIEAPDLTKGKREVPSKAVDNKELVDALKTITEKAQETDNLKKMMRSELDSIRKDIAKLSSSIQTARLVDNKEVQNLTSEQKTLDSKVSDLNGKIEQTSSRIDDLSSRPSVPSQDDMNSIKEAMAGIKKDVDWLLDEIDRINNARIKDKKLQTTYMVNEGMTSAQKSNLDELSGGGVTALHSHAGGAGDMTKAVYDPDADGVIVAAQLDTLLATDVEVATAVSDHAGAADPHTGYRLENADHSHQSAGAQAGKIDHGAALDGLTDDDHTQYQLESEKGAVSGYASLNASTKVTEQPAAITDHLEDSPANGEVTKAPTSNWAFDHNANVSAHHTKYTDAEAVAAVAAAGFTLAETKVIQDTIPASSDHTYAGRVVTMTAGTALVFGDICYKGADGKMEKALATNATVTYPAWAIALATIAEDATGLFLTSGWIRDDSYDFTVGSVVYLSDTTAAAPTKTIPASSGDIVQIIGIGHTADIMYFNPTLDFLELV